MVESSDPYGGTYGRDEADSGGPRAKNLLADDACGERRGSNDEIISSLARHFSHAATRVDHVGRDS